MLCRFCNKECKSQNSLRNHERLCKLNPDRQLTWFSDPKKRDAIMQKKHAASHENQYTKAKKLGLDKPQLSSESRAKISASTIKNNKSRGPEILTKISSSMKLAHAEGRAWNIGKSRWNNEPSYPEKFFMQVIENEFLDQNYQREFPLGIYSLDFAWPHLKKCIEIDGDQHQRFTEYINRDIKKDNFLHEHGWKVLRIVWKDMFADTKSYIQIAKEFIHTTTQ
jgi:very-short-patch-repair endonuclease